MDNLCFDFGGPDVVLARAPGDSTVCTDAVPGLQDIESFDQLLDSLLEDPGETSTVNLQLPDIFPAASSDAAASTSELPLTPRGDHDSLFDGMLGGLSNKRSASPVHGRPKKTQRVSVQESTGCGCTKRKCRTLYCACYRAGKACDPNVCLSCSGSCCNKENNPNGARAARKDHCNCRRNKCLKKYCECRLAERACGPKCHCAKDCMNCFD